MRTDASPSGLTHGWPLVCSRSPQHFPFKPGYNTFHWKNALSYSRHRCTNTRDKNTQQVTNNTSVNQWWRCCRASFSDLQRHERLIRNTDGSETVLTSTSSKRNSPWRPCWSVREFESSACWRSSRRYLLSPRLRPARVGLCGNVQYCSSPAPPGGQKDDPF